MSALSPQLPTSKPTLSCAAAAPWLGSRGDHCALPPIRQPRVRATLMQMLGSRPALPLHGSRGRMDQYAHRKASCGLADNAGYTRSTGGGAGVGVQLAAAS
jgi:hypothetical protein